MSSTLKVVLISILAIVVGFALFIYVGFYGLPWKKVIVGNQILNYLENKYDEEFKIVDRYYNFKDGHYNIKVHPINDPSITFSGEEGWGDYPFVDYYPEEIWAKQGEEDFRDVIEDIFPHVHHFSVHPAYGEGMDFAPKPPIPHYSETKGMISISLQLHEKFTGTEEQFEQMLALIESVKKNGGNIDIFIAYKSQDKEEHEKDSTTYATFSNEEIQKISTIEDVKKFYNNFE